MRHLFRRHRYPTQFPVHVTTARGEHPAKIVNVNHNGAAVLGVDGVNVGDRVFVKTPHNEVRGVVRWVKTSEIGVMFSDAISSRTVDALRMAVRTGKHRTRFSSSGMHEMR